MANKSDKDFGKRKPVSVPAAPRPGPPPAKRSGHVALLLMGTFAVGSAAYALMPSQSCERPPNVPSPSLLQGNTAECPPRSSSSSSGHGGSGGGSSSRSSYYSSDSSIEPFIVRHIRFWFARGAARRLRLVCARRWFLRRLTHSLHDAVKAKGFRLLPLSQVMETDVPRKV